ncbi:MAG TPA: hypothetical protein VKA46_35280 [Gemmataceae bacterium]|nr:hypothetical protein [Gemmataceae bacterium]
MNRLRQVGLWGVVAGALLLAYPFGLILLGVAPPEPFLFLAKVGLLGGPPLILLGGLMAVVGGMYATGADGKPASAHRSRGSALLLGFAIGAAAGAGLGVGVILLLNILLSAFDQGVFLMFLTGPAGGVVGGAVGAVVAARRAPPPPAASAENEGSDRGVR